MKEGVNHYEQPTKPDVKQTPVRPTISFNDLCPQSSVLLLLDLSISVEEPQLLLPSVMLRMVGRLGTWLGRLGTG